MTDIQKKLYDGNLKLIDKLLEDFHLTRSSDENTSDYQITYCLQSVRLSGKEDFYRTGDYALRRAISFFSEKNSLEDAAALATFPSYAEHFIKSALRLHLELSLPEKLQFGTFATGCSGSLRAIREYKRTGVLPRPQTQKDDKERFEECIEYKKHQYRFYTGHPFKKNQEDGNVQ